MALKEDVSLQNAEFLNHFITATYEAFKFETGTELEKGELTYDALPFTSDDITVMFGVIGEVRGYISLSMSEKTAKKIACALLKYDIRDINRVTRAIYPGFPPTHNEVGGVTPKLLYSSFCFSRSSPIRSF